MLPYGRQWIEDEDIAAVTEVLRSDWLTTGPSVERFERELAEQVGAQHAVVVANGTAALHLACLAAGIGPGDVLVTSPLTFVASANCALYCGATTTFADIDPETRNISSERLDALLRNGEAVTAGGRRDEKGEVKKPRCIVPVHYAGLPCNMVAISALAKTHDAVVIEDASHAIGAQYFEGSEWVRVGSCRHSDMTVFSFHPVKHITTGEGGAITTNDETFYRRLLLLRSHGITRDPDVIGMDAPGWYYEQQHLGYNYRLTDIQAALGSRQLSRLAEFVARRRELADKYRLGLDDFRGMVELPREPIGYLSSYHLYAVRLNVARLRGGRRAAYDALRARGIGVQVHYIPVHLQPYYRDRFGFRAGDYPNAESYYEETLSLPLYPALSGADHARVIDVVRGVLSDLRTDASDTGVWN